jgi:hypothetical protein
MVGTIMVDVVRLCRRRQPSPDSTRPAALVTSSPAVANGKVVVATTDGKVHLLRITPTVDSVSPEGIPFPLP